MKQNDVYESYLKSPYKSIKHSTYFESYDHFFGKYRNKNITFLEVGVLDGGSLFMWRDYFGPEARIIGVDLNPGAKKWEKEGFDIFIGSQSSADFWEYVKRKVGKIDIVLDDGGHTYEQQIVTVECLLDSLSDDGILVVEDTHTSYMHGFGPRNRSFMEYVKNRIDAVNKRFGNFSQEQAERRFWSIEVVESMVAFKINKLASNLVSEPTSNGGKDAFARDLRKQDLGVGALRCRKISKIFRKYVPFGSYLSLLVGNLVVNGKFPAGKYFK